METSAVLDQHDHVDSTAEIKMSLPEAKNTTETEQMDTKYVIIYPLVNLLKTKATTLACVRHVHYRIELRMYVNIF